MISMCPLMRKSGGDGGERRERLFFSLNFFHFFNFSLFSANNTIDGYLIMVTLTCKIHSHSLCSYSIFSENVSTQKEIKGS